VHAAHSRLQQRSDGDRERCGEGGELFGVEMTELFGVEMTE
jgi:hypothetical protein